MVKEASAYKEHTVRPKQASALIISRAFASTILNAGFLTRLRRNLAAEASKLIRQMRHWEKKFGRPCIVYAWTVTALDCYRILRQVVRYLRLKRAQAELVIYFQEHRKNRKGRMNISEYARISDEELKWGEECREKMHMLNKPPPSP